MFLRIELFQFNVKNIETGTGLEMFSDDMNISVSLIDSFAFVPRLLIYVYVDRIAALRVLNSNVFKLKRLYDCLYLLVLVNHHQMEFMWVPER